MLNLGIKKSDCMRVFIVHYIRPPAHKLEVFNTFVGALLVFAFQHFSMQASEEGLFSGFLSYNLPTSIYLSCSALWVYYLNRHYTSLFFSESESWWMNGSLNEARDHLRCTSKQGTGGGVYACIFYEFRDLFSKTTPYTEDKWLQKQKKDKFIPECTFAARQRVGSRRTALTEEWNWTTGSS